MFDKKCINGGNKHKFEPRYDKVIEASFDKIYVRDVCVWCGKTIERN